MIMSIPTSALVECPNNAILYVMVLDDVEFVAIPSYSITTVKAHIFGEGNKTLQNLHQLFVLCTASQMIGGDFAKFRGLLRIYEL